MVLVVRYDGEVNTGHTVQTGYVCCRQLPFFIREKAPFFKLRLLSMSRFLCGNTLSAFISSMAVRANDSSTRLKVVAFIIFFV